MKRKPAAIALIILGLVGSFTNFYFTNILMSAISNKDAANFLLKVIASVPGLMFNCQIILIIFFVYRLFLHPTHKYKMVTNYSIMMGVFSLVGFITTILSGTLLYGSLLTPNPFPGFHLIMLIYFALTMLITPANLLYFRKYYIDEPDIILKKYGVKHVLITILISLTFYYSLNRFGALLWSPTYILVRNLADTYPFYLSLTLPIGIVTHDLLYVFNVYKHKNAAKVGVAISSGLVILSVFLFVQIISRGSSDPQFIASISPAVPIERLLTFPIDIILSLVLVMGLGIFTLVDSIAFSKAKQKEPF